MDSYRALVISIAVHVLLSIGIANFAPFQPRPKPQYVDLIEQPKLPLRPHVAPQDLHSFAKAAVVPKELLTNKRKDPTVSSENEQFVLHETRARESGETRNRTPGISAPLDEASAAAHQPRMLDLSPHYDGDVATRAARIAQADEDAEDDNQPQREGEHRKNRRVAIPLGIERGRSTFGEDLNRNHNVDFGDFTALNSDRALYYSFYSRIDDAIRPRWVNYVRATLYELERNPRFNGNQVWGNQEWRSELEILLDREGNYESSILRTSSGVAKLDAAPSQAFRDAAQIQHPPPEMVKSDGKIHLYYSFVVRANPRGE
jgi:outer membrane biosynthesis protein TonB